jgi:hypothetical protein
MKIPYDAIRILEEETENLYYGTVSLTVHIRDGKLRYTVAKERSYLPETITKGLAADTSNDTLQIEHL